jgi:hypothetical protein
VLDRGGIGMKKIRLFLHEDVVDFWTEDWEEKSQVFYSFKAKDDLNLWNTPLLIDGKFYRITCSQNNDYIIDFYRDWIDTTVIPLNINYRSTHDIVEISNKLVKNTKETTHKHYHESKANKQKYKTPEFFYLSDEFEEADQLAKKILKMKSIGNNYSDFAILTRTNFQTQAIEQGLYENCIPYEVIGGAMFYELKEIKVKKWVIKE